MRYYSNFLLFEDFLEYLPKSSGILSNISDSIISPQVLVSENFCGTFLGKKIKLDFGSEGLIETSTLERISKSRLENLLQNGKYETDILSTSNCTSENGICKSCFESSFPGVPVPEIGSLTRVPSLFNTATEVFVCDGTRNEFSLKNEIKEFSHVAVIHEGNVLKEEISFRGNVLTVNQAFPSGDNLVIKLYKNYTTPLLWYFSKSHSAGLFGIKELESFPLLLRESLYNKILTPEILLTLKTEIEKYDTIPNTYLEYCDNIHSPLEQALFILYLYSIYANVE